jgi:hypothetical protein
MVKIGEGTRVWDPQGLWDDCVVGRFPKIGDGVRVGDRCKVEAFAFLPPGVVLKDEVFVGPHVCFTGRPTGERERCPTATGEAGMPSRSSRSVLGVSPDRDPPTPYRMLICPPGHERWVTVGRRPR